MRPLRHQGHIDTFRKTQSQVQQAVRFPTEVLMHKLFCLSQLESDLPEIDVNVTCHSKERIAFENDLCDVSSRVMETLQTLYYNPKHPASLKKIQKFAKATGVSVKKVRHS